MNIPFVNNVGPLSSNPRTRKRTITKFTDKLGLIYFGTVNQHTDDHKIIRGFTVSSSHRDNHYSVGTVDGYDVALVDRNDKIRQAGGAVSVCNWLILEIDLHTKQEIPHFFLQARNHDPKPYATLFTTFPTMKEVEFGTFENYDHEFTSRFSLFARPSRSIEVERLFPAMVTRVLGAHFWPLSAELHEDKLYVYADNERVTPTLLETMVESGLWLAKHLDLQAELV
ncbi:MAG TPA: hypothetical protein VFS65_01935 [Candidatus Saccharimonadales bacterium]|nr:hypothetical protein [Candidatus Saccharimonadales bacterium]